MCTFFAAMTVLRWIWEFRAAFWPLIVGVACYEIGRRHGRADERRVAGHAVAIIGREVAALLGSGQTDALFAKIVADLETAVAAKKN